MLYSMEVHICLSSYSNTYTGEDMRDSWEEKRDWTQRTKGGPLGKPEIGKKGFITPQYGGEIPFTVPLIQGVAADGCSIQGTTNEESVSPKIQTLGTYTRPTYGWNN